MKNSNGGQAQKARDYAFLLLKFRLRSQKEIQERLKRKGYDEPLIKETISFLKEKKFIDDELFAKTWIESRLRNSTGFRRIKQELSIKGISQEIIDREIEKISDNYSEEEVVLKISREKFTRLKDIEPDKTKRRIYAYLLRRGFSPDTVIEAINRL